MTYVDSSSVIERGVIFKERLGNRAVDATIGWIDPIGSHMDWDQAPVYGLMEWVMNLPAR